MIEDVQEIERPRSAYGRLRSVPPGSYGKGGFRTAVTDTPDGFLCFSQPDLSLLTLLEDFLPKAPVIFPARKNSGLSLEGGNERPSISKVGEPLSNETCAVGCKARSPQIGWDGESPGSHLVRLAISTD